MKSWIGTYLCSLALLEDPFYREPLTSLIFKANINILG